LVACRRCYSLDHVFFFSSRRRHTSFSRDWSSDVCSSDLLSLTGSVYGQMEERSVRLMRENGDLRRQIEVLLAEIEVIEEENTSRSEERRVGKECRSRGRPTHYRKRREASRVGEEESVIQV